MKYHLKTIIEGRRISVKVDYKRQVKVIIRDWTELYGDRFTYLDILPIETHEVKERKVKLIDPPKETPVVEIKKEKFNWPKGKTWLEKYGT